MEAMDCRLAMTGHSTLVIASVHLPSPKRVLRRDLRALFALGMPCDFNCKNIRWGCPSNNYNGIKLDELEDRLDFGINAPSKSRCFPHVVTHRPSTIDIALTKGIALNFNSIETIHGLTSDHRPVILKWDLPTAGGLFPSDSGRGERAEVPASSGSPEVSARYSRIDKSKNAALRRASAYPTPEYRSRARALQREVKARVREFRNESWSDLMEEIKPSHKAFWAVPKALKTEGYTLYPTQNLIIQWP
ncbi:RNA-directed DNA polymerase from mobile element jockey [Eumeta japonica]|uniref:RNA-directed DNA polymerase from mobile element jockey n=1 Tax=Eumeta variegata TaxID=151549 RepID=A0A4C1UTH8_EUMVA|nr:RNA-directed DNA polymerase from mobile element jockey [Eumeta japonica]